MADFDVVEAIKAADSGGDPDRLAIKYRNMRGDLFAFLRGSCPLFYARLPDLGALAKSPPAWACGDMHLENFGSYLGDNGLVYFDLNDFDEGVLAPCLFDVLRCSVSIGAARRKLGLDKREAARLKKRFVEAYRHALAGGKAYWVERDTADGTVGQLIRAIKGKTRRRLIEERTFMTKQGARLRLDGRYALPADAKDHKRVEAIVDRFAASGDDRKFLTVIDVARRIAGLGSLGRERYVILVEGGGTPATHRLLDLKIAVKSSVAHHTGLVQPEWPTDAERVVAVQKYVEAVTPAFLAALVSDGRAYVLRDLQPQADRLDLASFAKNGRKIGAAIDTMGALVAWGQLRSGGRQSSAITDTFIDFGRSESWLRDLTAIGDICLERCEQDYAIFCKAYDRQAFGPELPPEP